MKDNEIINVGDVCAYFYDNQNTSFSIVEVVRELSYEVVVVKFHQVLRDDSGNGLFTYLCDKGKTMNVSRKYLHKLDLINRKKAEVERLQKENKEQKLILEAINDEINPLPFETDFDKGIKKAKSEAYREYEGRVRMILEKKYGKGYMQNSIVIADLDNLTKELTRNLHETYTESKNDLEEC